MNTEAMPAPTGSIEPHKPLLKLPNVGQPLYKVMTLENLVRSISQQYLHFNRVDSYIDFPGADHNDGQQLPLDHSLNAASKFANNPEYSVANYYDLSRSRTYACCFSLDNSNCIWANYGNSGARGKICVVFDFDKLRTELNLTLRSGNGMMLYNGVQCRQIFSINYGLVQYVERNNHQESITRHPNPIQYTYLKDQRYSEERELRISLSALGRGHFILKDKSFFNFPKHFKLAFDFRRAIADGTITEILLEPRGNIAGLCNELAELRIFPKPDFDPAHSDA